MDDKEKEGEGEKFTAVESLDFWESLVVNIGAGEMGVKVTGMPGKHVPDGVLGTLNDLVGAVPPTNGWMVELGRSRSQTGDWECNYRFVENVWSREMRMLIPEACIAYTYLATRCW